MRQGLFRGLAVCALAVVALAPAATAGALGDGSVHGDGVASTPAPRPTTGPSTTGTTWSALVARAQRLGLVAGDVTAADARPAAVTAAAAVAKTVTVTPHTDLVSGQRVAVSGTGFADTPVVVVECAAGATSPYDCDLNGFDVLEPAADGSVSTQFAVHRRVLASSGTVDCASAAGACVIGLASLSSLAAFDATAPLTFDPNAPAPNPAVTVTPSTGLLDQQQVTVAGSGFVPGARLRIRQCSMVDPFCEGYPLAVTADANGAFSRTYAVRLRAYDANGNASNCLALTCQVRVISTDNADYDGGAPIAFAPGQPLPPTPHVTVTPSTGLRHHEVVSVSGTGFDANAFVDVYECAHESLACDDQLGGAPTDAQGTFSLSVSVSRLVGAFGPTGTTIVDCATAACTIQAAGSFDETEHALAADAPIAFDASQPAPQPPSVGGSPTTNLPFAADVHLTGTGFAPNESVFAQFCAQGTAFPRCSTFREALTDGNGGLDLTMPVRRIVYSGSTSIDCVAADVDCTIQVSGQFSFEQATIALTFDPSAPVPPPPTVVVTPHTGLTHLQTVDVVGSNFAPNADIDISECGPGSFGYCPESLGFVQSDSSGGFTASVPVSRLVGGGDDFPGSLPAEISDCAAVQCSIMVNAFGPDDSIQVGAPIAFDAAVPPPSVPVVTVDPHTDLPYLSTITVHGTGYAPGEQVSVTTCGNGADFGFCDSAGFATADAAGTVTVPVTARRVTGYVEEGFVDCVDPDALCTVSVQGAHSYERTEVALEFDPNAPVPPAPTATVTPHTGLGYVQTVTVAGDGFAPGPVPVQQCTDLGGQGRFCPAYAQLQADASGHVAGTFEVRRILKPGFTAPIDCLVAGCTLQIGNDYPNEHADVALGFDPNAVPPPPPALTITPSTDLFDGRHVTVAGARFKPGSRVGMTECEAGTTVIAEDCDVTRVHEATVGADGTFSERYVTESVLSTPNGPVDCTVAPGTCVLAAANAPQSDEFAVAPLGFDAPELTVDGVGITEGTGDMTMAPVHVMLSKPDRNPIMVHWIAQAGTASPGTDYTSMRGTLTIPAGETDAMIDAEVVADAMDEPTETFRIRVVDALGTRITDRVGTVTIHDDDAAPTVTVRDTRRREDHGEAHAEVLLSAASGRTVIVHYVTHHGSARAGSDYVRKDSRLVFRPGETRHLVRVVLVDDHVHEGTETFHVEIDRVEAATSARSVATVTITDDD
jgi:hypothetical protein